MVNQEILELLTAHLGQGRLDRSSLDRLSRLDEICPDTCRARDGDVFRSLTLDPADIDKILQGQDVHLDERSHDCWSKSEAAIRCLMRNRLEQDPDRTLVLLKRTIVGAAIDIESLSCHMGLDLSGMGSWSLYAAREREIILRNPPGPVTIRPEDVAMIYEAGDVQKLWDPVPGESFCDFNGNLRIVEDFKGWDDCGCAMVISGGSLHRIVHLGSGWEYGAGPEEDRLEM